MLKIRSLFFYSALSLATLHASSAHAKSAIFFHPDGLGLNTWQALRYSKAGPNGTINWDKLQYTGVYIGTMSDSAAASSNGGATAHAYGIKPRKDSYGLINGKPITAASGFKGSLIQEAISKGLKTALINSGSIIEPGTGVFAAQAKDRNDYDAITEQVINSGVDIIMSGGEEHMLPASVQGKHGVGTRKDARNLIEEAQKLGYKVVYNQSELKKAVKEKPEKLLGVFASFHTFNDMPDSELEQKKLPRYNKTAPTIGQMSESALQLLQGHEFLMVIEEEATDNFANKGNPDGVIEALNRADDALGIMVDYQKKIPDLMIITASDSDAGGMQVESVDNGDKAPYSYKNKDGKKIYFNLKTVGAQDYAGGSLVRSSHPLPPLVENILVYKIIYDYLFL